MSVHKNLSPGEREFRQLKSFVATIYPATEPLTQMVSPEAQQRELQQLREGLRTEQFYMVVDFPTLTIQQVQGIEELGYQSDRFTFRQYLNCIPNGGMLQLVTLLGKQSFRFSERASVMFMYPKLVAQVPITAADGRVMLTKRTISPWQHTETGKMTAYLSEFTILKPYENEPMNPRFINLPKSIEVDFIGELSRIFAGLPIRDNPLSPKEIRILKQYADPANDACSAAEMAALAGVTVHTLHRHNKNILQKAKTMFSEDIAAKTAREVAYFLKKCGFLG